MNLFRSSNPALSTKRLEKTFMLESGATMTVQGTINKTSMMLVIVIMAAFYSWSQAFKGANVMPYVTFGTIGGLITALLTILWKPKWSPYTAPIYAVLEGFALGGISALFEMASSGITIKAVGLTFTTFFAMLFLYKTGIIKATEKFKAIITSAIGGIFIFYIATWILAMFGVNISLFSGGLIGIGISLFIVGIAALSLIIDFDQIEKSAETGAPQFMEWYAAMGLMITLIWLYMEILRLYSLVTGND